MKVFSSLKTGLTQMKNGVVGFAKDHPVATRLIIAGGLALATGGILAGADMLANMAYANSTDFLLGVSKVASASYAPIFGAGVGASIVPAALTAGALVSAGYEALKR